MKKTFLTLALAVSLSAAAAESVPYSSDIWVADGLCAGWQNVSSTEELWEFASPDKYDFYTPATKGGAIRSYGRSALDCMLISPAVTLEAGTSYTVGYWLMTPNTSDKENVALYMGTEGTLEALKGAKLLVDKTDYNNKADFERIEVKVTPETDGEYFFGIHDHSGSWMGNVLVTGFFVTEGEYVAPERPEIVENIPYAPDFKNKVAFRAWTSLAGPGAGTQDPWEWNDYGRYPQFDFSQGLKEDNYFISPALNITEAGNYLVEATVTAYGTYDLCVGTDPTDPASFSTVFFTRENVSEFEEPVSAGFDITVPGKYYVAMHVRADEGSSMGYRLHTFKIKLNVPVPALVEDLKAVSDPNDELKVALSWTNPATDNGGARLDAITKVEIARNGEVVATLTEGLTPGAAASYTDTPAEAGSYSYTVTVYNANGAFDKDPMVAQAGYVGRPVAEFPYSFNASSAFQSDVDMFTAEDANHDGATWRWDDSYSWSKKFISSNEEMTVNADDYLATPYIHLTPGYYRLEYNIASQYNSYEAGYATDRHNIAATFVKCGGVTDEQASSGNDRVTIVPIETEGDYVLVWRHTGESTHTYYLDCSINKISLTAQDMLPGIAAGLTAKTEGTSLVVNLNWTNPATDNAGKELKEITKIEIARGEEVIATLTDAKDLVPGTAASYTDNSLTESGEYTYTVTVHNANGTSEEDAPKTTVFAGAGKEIPYTADFNEWNIVDYDNTWYCWEVDATDGYLFYSQSYGVCDDGAYTPYIYLEEGKHYTVTFTTFEKSDYDTALFEVRAGTSPLSAVKLTEISHEGTEEAEHTINLKAAVADTQADETEGEDATAEYTVAPGNSVIGFHVTEPTYAYIKDFKIEENKAAGAAEAIAAADGVITVADGTVYFAAGATDIVIADIAGRVLFAAAQAPEAVALGELGIKSGVVIVRASSADGTPAVAKAAL